MSLCAWNTTICTNNCPHKLLQDRSEPSHTLILPWYLFERQTKRCATSKIITTNSATTGSTGCLFVWTGATSAAACRGVYRRFIIVTAANIVLNRADNFQRLSITSGLRTVSIHQLLRSVPQPSRRSSTTRRPQIMLTKISPRPHLPHQNLSATSTRC